MIANNILNQIRTLLIKIKNNEGLSSIAPIHYCAGGPNSNKENRKKKMWELKGINHTLIIHKRLFTYRRIHRQNIRNTKGWVKRLDARSVYRYHYSFILQQRRHLWRHPKTEVAGNKQTCHMYLGAYSKWVRSIYRKV